MTVCIAGVCKAEKASRRIILCSDTLIDYQGIGNITTYGKSAGISSSWCLMYAGDVPKARELSMRIGSHFRTFDNNAVHLTDDVIRDAIRKPLREQQNADADNYVYSQIGMSLDDMLSPSRAIPEQTKNEILRDIRTMQVGCDLILAGFVRDEPRLYTVLNGSVDEAEGVVAIGCGYAAALASLCKRNYQPEMDIEEALYYIYEAKKASEGIAGVGDGTSVWVVASPYRTSQHAMPLSNFDFLDEQHKRFGLQPFFRSADREEMKRIADPNLEFSNLPPVAKSSQQLPKGE